MLLEMLPLVAFFASYYFSKNLFLATAVCIVASWLQILICQYKYKQISKNTWLSTILITVFGGLTILLHNKTFVMLKPTVLFWLVGISLFLGQLTGKNGIKLMLGREISLPDTIWRTLNLTWSGFFILMGGVNLYVAFHYSEYVWVKFKVFGSLGLSLILMLISSMIVWKYHRTTSK